MSDDEHPDCGQMCGWQWPYGWVPEDGCPIHDVSPPHDTRLIEGHPRRIPTASLQGPAGHWYFVVLN